MLARFRDAQRMAQQAQELQARANQLIAGVQVWAEDLHEKYELDASKDEGVLDDGTIIRAA